MNRRDAGRAFAAAALALGAAIHVQAQDYPTKPIRLLIGAAPGGGTDAIGRLLGEQLALLLKQPVVPDNRPGVGGMIASQELLKSAPDGYTLLVTQNGHTTNPSFFKKLPYDTLRDFTPITTIATTPLVLVSSAGSGVKTYKDLLEAGKRSPNGLSFASAESSTRLAIEQLREALGQPIAAVSYKGTGPAVTDVAGGHVPFSVTTIASVLPFRTTGKLHYVAVLAPQRSAFLPDVPTLAEQGQPGIEVRGWWGVLAPPNLPPALTERLNAAVRTVVAMPEVRQKLQSLSAEPWVTTPQEFDAFIRKEVPALQRLARQAGIEPE
jgi:tripartite-type tricarboxylate transporter receptor subunit TctC